MADDRLEQAVDIVARHVIARMVTKARLHRVLFHMTEEHEDAIEARITDLISPPDQNEVAAAYDFLAGRAEGADS